MMEAYTRGASNFPNLAALGRAGGFAYATAKLARGENNAWG